MLSLIALASIAADQNALVGTAYLDNRIVCRPPSQLCQTGRVNRQSPVKVGRSKRQSGPASSSAVSNWVRLAGEAPELAADQ